jgi:hypothetical protein
MKKINILLNKKKRCGKLSQKISAKNKKKSKHTNWISLPKKESTKHCFLRFVAN